ncbi:NADPH:quinone reductase, partial [Gammaproteobacteria bacterium]|nr:NADPH:quinone reductase [Gammaproteobacteria bacterium]
TPSLPFLDMMYMDLTLRMVIVYAMPESAKQAAIEAISIALEQEQLEHRVAHVVPLEKISKAHELIEIGGFGGCVVVSMESPE